VPGPTGSDHDVTMAPSGAASAATPVPAAGAGRFAPGSIVAGRYRLVALLGRGGMGEVYRADDLTLDQPVALKFLPDGTATDPARLAQFHNELRVARQVSHKNVCRLYDLGEADGRRFLTMEYVDGEDLASLLRRIGRVPEDKAVEIARQLCAAVSAAHERGVLHRDRKPANVMLDGDGNVRVTDFGIATAANDAGAPAAGTPQYMAPELLKGQPASVKSDLYALGLILFEVFTGRRAFDAKTLGDLKALHDTGTVTTPSSIVRDLDPAVERVIMRCLDRDPDRRPASALTIAASLPGGDPLAAALAAGETPSPQMVIAAGESEALPVARGLAAVGVVLAGVLVLAVLAPRVTVVGRVPNNKPPAVLADRAQQVLAALGYSDPVADSAAGLAVAQPFISWLATNDRNPRRWDQIQVGSPPALIYWHRTSPRLMLPIRTQIQVSPNDPPLTVSGMTYVILDTLGRIVEFQAVPPQFDPEPDPHTAPRWEPLFDLAGLKMAAFTPVAPQWSPRDYADTRAAWEGPMTDRPDLRVRVEAAAYRGRPTSMLVLGPWSRPTRMQAETRSISATLLNGFVALLIAALGVASLVIARYNLRAQRADRRAAARLAFAVIGATFVTFVIGGHHVPDVQQEIANFTRIAGQMLFGGCTTWVLYLALEPYVRRFWPDGILGWARLLSGHVRDPRVGRDVLIGCASAVGLTVVELLYHYLPPLAGYPSAMPFFESAALGLTNSSTTVSMIIDLTASGVIAAMFAVLGYVLLRLMLRRPALAAASFVIVFGLMQSRQLLTSAAPLWITAIFAAITVIVVTLLVVRYGLLVLAVSVAVGNILESIPLTYSLSHWTATASNLAIAFVLGLTLFGFYASRAGQPLFGKLEG